MQVETERLILRDLEETDIDAIMDLASDPEVIQYLDYITFESRADAEVWVKEKIYYNHQTPRAAYNFAICLKDTAEFIGWIGIGESDDITRGDLDFAYALKRAHWGKGYATEALKAIIDLSFETLPGDKIFGQCDIRNQGSINVMKKAGMEFETEFVEDGKTSARYTVIKDA